MTYLVTALLCVIRRHALHRGFWWAIALLLLVLALIGLTPIPRSITGFGRGIAYTEGWYELRRPVQFASIIGILILSAILFKRMVITFRRDPPELVGLLAMSSLLSLILIRLISFHYVDRLLAIRIWNVQVGWGLEVLLLLCIGIAAHWRSISRYGKMCNLSSTSEG